MLFLSLLGISPVPHFFATAGCSTPKLLILMYKKQKKLFCKIFFQKTSDSFFKKMLGYAPVDTLSFCGAQMTGFEILVL